MTGASDTPSLSVDGHIATLRLRRPGQANRLGPQDLDAIREHLDAVNANDAVRVLRIQSEGKYFCSGYDISSLASESAPSSLYFGQTMDLIEAARPVAIAAVQGGAPMAEAPICVWPAISASARRRPTCSCRPRASGCISTRAACRAT